MSSPIPLDFSLDLQLSSQTTAVAAPDCATGDVKKLFKDILADENLLSDVMARLKEALPEELYSQIEQMVESGNGLPLAAIFPPELTQFSQVFTGLQDGLKLDSGNTPPFVASALKIGDYLQKTNGDASDKVLDNLGRNLSEALTQISSKGEGLAKQIQELMVATKAELATSDAGSKLIMPTSSGVEGSVTQSTALGTAISGLVQLPNLQVNSSSPLPPAVAAPMGEEGWGQAMGERIMWMMGKGIQGASIRINPPELGPIQVQLSVKNDRTSVHMLVQHGVVKEALEAAIPRLREMLNEGNLHLVNVDVSHRESPDQSGRSSLFSQDQREQMEQFLQDQDMTSQIEEEEPRYYRSTGLLDDYA